MENNTYVRSIDAPCQIAYHMLTGKLELRPYLDLRYRHHIWGIAIQGVVYKKTHDPAGSWTSISETDDPKVKSRLPSVEELHNAYLFKQAFNNTIAVLKSCNIDADYWQDGYYWSDQSCDETLATALDFSTGYTDSLERDFSAGLVRKVSLNTKQPPFIVVGLPLIYWNRIDRFEIKQDLLLPRSNQIWGLQLDKDMFVSIRQSSSPCTWDEAYKQAEEKSTASVCVTLPSMKMLDLAHERMNLLNRAAIILRSYGIQADLWQKEMYWSNMEYDKRSAMARNMANTYSNLVVRKSALGYCRLMALNKT